MQCSLFTLGKVAFSAEIADETCGRKQFEHVDKRVDKIIDSSFMQSICVRNVMFSTCT